MKNEQLNAINEIRSLMERSSKYLSLSGLSGVLMGLIALAGAGLYCYSYGIALLNTEYYRIFLIREGVLNMPRIFNMLSFALPVLVFSLLTAGWMTYIKSQKIKQAFWDATSRRLLISLMIPMVAGGLFIVSLISKGLVDMVAPVSLIFYGLALVNASKYAISDLRYLGFAEIALGLVSSWWTGIGLISWMLGFGLAHIVYGIYIYSRYEKREM